MPLDLRGERWIEPERHEALEDGSFELAVPTDGVARSIWVSAPGYLAQGIVLISPSSWNEERLFELGRAEPVTVRVMHYGQPVEGATVRQFGHARNESRDSDRLLGFDRVWVTAEGGSVEVAPFPEGQWLVASKGDEQSSHKFITTERDITLELSPTVSVEGAVLVELDPSEPPPLVRCLSDGETIAMSRVRPSGEWGPVKLTTHSSPVIFRLEGGAFLPLDHLRNLPAAGESLTVDFDPVRGIRVGVLVRNRADVPIGGALVEAAWQEEGTWHRSFAETGPDGRATLYGCKAGHLWFLADADGYVRWDAATAETRMQSTEPIYEITLLEGASLRGRCTRDGRPVKQYSLHYWRMQEERSVEIVKDEDGRFELNDVPRGTTSLRAVADGLGASPVVVVNSEEEDSVDVLLELTPPIRGRGRVVDAYTGEPVAGASVTMYNRSLRGGWLDGMFAPAHTDEDGRFVLSGLVQGQNHLFVRSTDHQGGVTRTVPQVAEYELGDLHVPPRKDLVIELTGDRDYTEFWGTVVGVQPWTQFDKDGVLVVSNIQPGTYMLGLAAGYLAIDRQFTLAEGGSWHVVVDVSRQEADQGSLMVRIDEGLMETTTGTLAVMMRTILPGGVERQEHVVPNEGAAVRVPGPFGDHAFLELLENGERSYAYAEIDVSEWLGRTYHLDAQPKLKVRVVAASDGLPVPHASVWLTLADNRTGWITRVETNSGGVAELASSERDDLVVHVCHIQYGAIWDRPLSIENGEALVELDPSGELHVEFEDATGVVEGVSAHLTPHSSELQVARLTMSDAQGISTSPPLQPGRYRVYTRGQPSYWAPPTTVDVGPGTTHVTIRLRSFGSLEFFADDGEGNPLQGIRLDASFDGGGTLAEWASTGHIDPTHRGLMTDADGRLVIPTLPAGTYTWTAVSESGETVTGSVQVRAAQRALVSASF